MVDEFSFGFGFGFGFLGVEKDKTMAAAHIRSAVMARMIQDELMDSNSDYLHWAALCENPDIDADFIMDHPEFPWDKVAVSCNPNMRWEDLMRLKMSGRIPRIYVGCFCKHGKVEVGDISVNRELLCQLAANPRLSWADLNHIADYAGLSVAGSSQVMQVACENSACVRPELLARERAIDWSSYATNLCINHAFGTLDGLQMAFEADNRLRLAWPWEQYKWNTGITADVLNRYYPNKYGWNYESLSLNPGYATWERVLASLDRPWRWHLLSKRPDFATIERVRGWPRLRWCLRGLLSNRNFFNKEGRSLLLDAFPFRGDWPVWPNWTFYPSVWKTLPIRDEAEAEAETFARRWMAAWKVQKKWLHLYYTPGTPVWERRMGREFKELAAAL